MNQQFSHIPVLLNETLEFLQPKPGDRVLDCTIGLGGHSRAFLEKIAPNGELIGLDADADNLGQASANLPIANCQLLHQNFRNLPSLNLGSFDIIFADLGISSPHLDDPARGFSFRSDGPLDMRLDRSTGMKASQLIEESSEDDLANVLFQYGEIRQSRKLASALKQSPPHTTAELASACEAFFGFKGKSMLPQIFQALRIAVNDELGALQSLLASAPNMLNTGGRLGIISFHSLEDRLVKLKFRELTTAEVDDTTGQDVAPAPFVEINRKAIKPSEQEIEQNPRSRSARLRFIRKR